MQRTTGYIKLLPPPPASTGARGWCRYGCVCPRQQTRRRCSAAVDQNTPGPLGGEARGGRRLAAELPGCAGERENSEQERSELGLSHGTPLCVPLGIPISGGHVVSSAPQLTSDALCPGGRRLEPEGRVGPKLSVAMTLSLTILSSHAGPICALQGPQLAQGGGRGFVLEELSFFPLRWFLSFCCFVSSVDFFFLPGQPQAKSESKGLVIICSPVGRHGC